LPGNAFISIEAVDAPGNWIAKEWGALLRRVIGLRQANTPKHALDVPVQRPRGLPLPAAANTYGGG
jgi:hypothetical protein